MTSSWKSRRILLSSVLLLGLSVFSIAPVAGFGQLLRGFDVPAFAKHPGYFPVGVAFDGKNLWYSQPSISAKDIPGIFLITTTGTLLQTLSLLFPEAAGGAIAWDGSNLWVASFQATLAGATVFQVSVGSTPTILKSLNLDPIFAPDNECAIIDGLDFDPSTGTLWVSPDVGCNSASINGKFGVAYNIDTSGNLIQRVAFPFSVSGVAVVGRNLYVVDRFGGNIDHVDLKGNVLSSFPMSKFENPTQWAEDLAFDASTFAPACALWAMQPYEQAHFTLDSAALAAYHIDCP
jgi:hypothetical protein